VAGDFIEHDERWRVADYLVEESCPRGGLVCFTLPNQVVCLGATQLIGNFSPQGVSGSIAVLQSQRGVQVRANDASDADGSWRRDKLGVQEMGRRHMSRSDMVQSDQVMGLATAKGGLKADDGIIGRFCARQTTERFIQ